ncbi:MAG: hypothetical protein IJ560_02630 [Alphaproteobacteria bacterium]|nr:hypothetical protein [Alphaproteobacteria bacterium]
MHLQRGSFLLQALLALTLIFAFMPFVANRLALRDVDAKMYAATHKVDVAQTAARIYVRENANALPYNETVVSGTAFSDLLEPYGLPLGFVPKTSFGQDISLVINKNETDVSAYLRITGGRISSYHIAEMARRIGFYAMPDDNSINVGLALENTYSDIVRRNESDIGASAFLTDLDMGKFTLNGVGDAIARRGDFAGAEFGTLSIVGAENGRKVRNKISQVTADRTVFQTQNGESALSLTRGTLSAKSVSGRTVAKFGNAGSFSSRVASVYDFAMTAGHTGFSGPLEWNVRGNVVTSRINFSVERLDVSSYINVSRGQDVYIGSDSLEYTTRSGIEVDSISAANITLRDQTSNSLLGGGSGSVILDIRPSGTSIMPDVLVSDVDNGGFRIIKDASSDDGDTVDCKTVIEKNGGEYNQKSLAQNIICQYVFWQRLEKRINIKQCLMSGKNNCV